LNSFDGEIGKVREFYFDDKHWTIRYLVADTGNWLTGRQVLISPYSLVAGLKGDQEYIAVRLTKKQIEDSPSLGSDQPVSRQFEEAYYGFYDWPMYWSGPYAWGVYPSPSMAGSFPYIVRDPKAAREAAEREKAWDPHLRSTHDVSDHRIQAQDGEIGHVADFIIDEETWTIRYLIIDTRNWWPGKKVLVSPQWIERVSWNEKTVFVNLSREAIKLSPQYTEESLVTRDYETKLHRHYNRAVYWGDESAAQEHSR
jgi:hypothetical protein